MDLNKINHISTKRLKLRYLDYNDAFAFQKMTNYPEITNVVDILPTPFTLEDAQNLLTHNQDTPDFFFGIFFKENNELIAVIGVHPQSNNYIEIGYWVSPLYQRQGIANEALQPLLHQLYKTYPDQKIIAECRPENQASWNLLEKIGFTSTEKAGHRPGRKLLLYNPKIM